MSCLSSLIGTRLSCGHRSSGFLQKKAVTRVSACRAAVLDLFDAYNLAFSEGMNLDEDEDENIEMEWSGVSANEDVEMEWGGCDVDSDI
jgi:hypothetical protein